MATTEPTFGWRTPDGNDDLRDGWTAIDNLAADIAATMSHRLKVCTSGTRPSAPVAGDTIVESDTGRMYRWIAAGVLGAGLPGVWDQFGGPPEQYSPSYVSTFADLVATNWQPLKIFKFGRRCWLEGSFTGPVITQGTMTEVATIPSAVTPIATTKTLVPLWAPGPGYGHLQLVVGTPAQIQFMPVSAATSSGWDCSGTGYRWRTNN